jgi:tyrosine-protein phosphatase YwqE
MFSFFKKKQVQEDVNYFPVELDIHSHILPGIDDGSPNLETSIELVKGLMSLGVKKSIATPHIIGDLYRNNPETINGALSLLQAELKKQQIDFEVRAAAEYMLDSYFFELLNNGQQLLTLKDNIILTEFSYASMPDDPGKHSFAIQMAGYSPILAHPERYPYYYGNYKMYHRLSELGFMLQLNLLSLTGYYGKEAVKAAEYMLKNELISFVGTDMHHERHLGMLCDPRTKNTLHHHLSHRNWNDFLE